MKNTDLKVVNLDIDVALDAFLKLRQEYGEARHEILQLIADGECTCAGDGFNECGVCIACHAVNFIAEIREENLDKIKAEHPEIFTQALSEWRECCRKKMPTKG